MAVTEKAYQHLLKTVKELVSEGEKYSVDVAIEGVHLFVINTPQIMARLMSDVCSENIKVIFDPCNLINLENYKEQDRIINDMFDLVGDKIVAIHAKDFSVENGEMKRANPGEGMLNYKLILEKMREHNLDIPIICEGYNEDEAREAFITLSKVI